MPVNTLLGSPTEGEKAPSENLILILFHGILLRDLQPRKPQNPDSRPDYRIADHDHASHSI
jgi:hypothetical protein